MLLLLQIIIIIISNFLFLSDQNKYFYGSFDIIAITKVRAILGVRGLVPII